VTLQLDHIVIAVNDLEAVIRDYGELGFTVTRGGVHANRATCNALVTFANGTYLELLAATGEPPLPGLIDFSGLLRSGEGLVGFALRSDDLDAEAARLRAECFAVDEVIPGERRRGDGTVIRWKLALLGGDFAPFLIQDVTLRAWRISDDPAVTTHPNQVVGLHSVEIAVQDRNSAENRYRRLFGVPPQSEAENDFGGVVLSGMDQKAAESSEALFAVHLTGESQASDPYFSLVLSHGVRFTTIARQREQTQG
jgi:catechol 2,3-dioxygenase-like lactoylglutathione lyase family enzyme